MSKKFFSMFIVCVLALSLISINVFADNENSIEEENPKLVEFFGNDINNGRQLNENDEIVAVASFSADVRTISISCAYWGTESSFMYNIYTFDTDWEKSTEGTPVKTGEIVYDDNIFQDITWTEDEAPLAKGIYVIQLTDFNGKAGVRYNEEYEGQYVYENGIYTPENSLKMNILYDTVPEVPYGELTKPVVEQSEIDYAPGAVMNFSDNDADSYAKKNGNLTTSKIADGKLVINITAGLDPYLTINALGDAEELDIEEYPVMLIKVRRSEGTPLVGQFFFNTTLFKGPNAQGAVSFSYADTTDWQMIPINLGSNTNYVGEIVSYRFDPFSTTEADCTVEIEWIAFFETMTAAEAFDGDFTKFVTPTPVPTPTPEVTPDKSTKATAETPAITPTKAPVSTSTKEPADDNGGANIGLIIGIAAIIVAGIVALIFIWKKKK